MSKKILFVLTSATATPWGKNTGYWLEEVAAPYNHLTALGYEIEIASIAGGVPPVDETSTAEPFTSEDTHKFIADPVATAKMSSTRPVEEYVERARKGEFACVFLPGGHGAAIDFSPSAGLKSVIEGCYGANGVVGAVCHGCAGLISVVDPATGEPLVMGKTVTGFSDVEETQIGLLGVVPFSIEAEFKRLGGNYKAAEAWGPLVCVQDRVVTGQNPKSSKQVGEKLAELLA